MTKVQLRFALREPLDELAMSRIPQVYSRYGILRIDAQSGAESLTVEYDATRFSPKDVEAALACAGLPLAERIL
jgi:hypothetical protein